MAGIDGNELAAETSPYLLQHAAQPVHWRAWSPTSLAMAREKNCPIMLSIGYAACHWCHVMAHESFDDPDIAAILNEHFVSIKVDREERPDIDQIYMTALHAMGQQGGWPLTMFLTPQGEPIWGGTYFPPEPRWGRPGFAAVLRAVAQAYRRGDRTLLGNVELLVAAIRQAAQAAHGGRPGAAAIEQATAQILGMVDFEHGGFRGAPKFPNFPAFLFLAQRSARGSAPAAAAMHGLLRALCSGGIFDHPAGGLFRYSTDYQWLVPHFEKMLYDNAQFVELLALAHAGAPHPAYRATASATVAFMQRELGAGGAFAASLDADTAGGEGAFYVWTEAEIDAALGAGATLFGQAFDVTPQGNWEGRTILRRLEPWDERVTAEARFAAELAVLAKIRETRARPALDDKVLADWNGLAIIALCRAAHVFDQPQWLSAAQTCFAVLGDRLRRDGRWHHVWRHGRISAAALLDDLASVGRAALALYEATGQKSYLGAARQIVSEADEWFGPARDGYAMTAADARDIPASLGVRPRSGACGAVPSGSGMMAEVLSRLFHLTGEQHYRDRAQAVLEAFAGSRAGPVAQATLLAAAELLEDGVTIVIAGETRSPSTRALVRAALAAPDPACCVLRLEPGDQLAPGHPAFAKAAPRRAAVAYLCRRGTCLPPIDDPETLARALRTFAPG